MDNFKKIYGNNIYYEHFDIYMDDGFSRMETFIELLKNNDAYEVQQLGFLGEELFKNMKRRTLNAVRCIERHFGEIKFITSRDDRGQIRERDILYLSVLNRFDA